MKKIKTQEECNIVERNGQLVIALNVEKMITEKDLQEAIAECQGVRNPNANTAIKLAAFLTIQREMFGDSERFRDATQTLTPSYSYAAPPETTETTYRSAEQNRRRLAITETAISCKP